jgi:flagellar biosynthesis protein FlhF
MRLRSFVAPTARQAMARLQAALGEDAVIVATQTQEDGQVRVTGALAQEQPDLSAILAPPECPDRNERLHALARFHELSELWVRRAIVTTAGQVGIGARVDLELEAMLKALYQFQPLPQGRPLLLSGLPGSGKSVTVAKLAAREILAGRTVTVVNADNGRAGGNAQLRALLAPLGLEPLAPADPSELAGCLRSAGKGAVLIDSPSFNPLADHDFARLPALLEAADAELVLVLAAGMGMAEATELGHIFAALGSRHMVATRLDCARRLGSLLGAADGGLAFTLAGIGPTIGNGLQPLSAPGLTRLLLHRERQADPAEPRP